MSIILLTDRQADRGEAWVKPWLAVYAEAEIVAVDLGEAAHLAVSARAIAPELARYHGAVVVAHGRAARGLVHLATYHRAPLIAGAVLVEPFDRPARDDWSDEAGDFPLPAVDPLSFPARVLPMVGRSDPRHGRSRVHAAMWEAGFEGDAVDPAAPLSGETLAFIAAVLGRTRPDPLRARAPLLMAV